MLSNFKDWFKEKWRWILVGFILVLIITLSFGIGYLIAQQVNPAPIIIEKCADFVSKP